MMASACSIPRIHELQDHARRHTEKISWRELAEACHREQMPPAIGFYYSPPDMNHPRLSRHQQAGQGKLEWRTRAAGVADLSPVHAIAIGGVADPLWSRRNHLVRRPQRPERNTTAQRVIEMIRELQPATLVNDRIGVDADYETPEQFIPTAIPTKGVMLTGIDPKVSRKLKNTVPRPEDFRLWETCMTINNTWAYNKNDHDFKSEQTLIRSLVEVASRGGNFLLNVGPQPDGQIQPEFQQRLRAIGDWLTLNGDSIYGTTYGPVQGVAGLRTTAKGKSIYLHIFDWPAIQPARLPASRQESCRPAC